MEVKSEDKTKKLGTESIVKLLIEYSVPAIAAMIINAVYNLIDKIFIGKIPESGTIGLAALGVAFPIMNLMIAVTMFSAAGGAILFSIKLGEKNKEEAGKILGTSFLMLLIGALITMTFGLYFITPIVKFFGADRNILPEAETYISILFLGSIFQYVSFGLCHFIRADGYPRIAMITMFSGAIANIFFDYLFINVFKWGMLGAGLATSFAQSISFFIAISHFIGKNCTIPLKISNITLNFNRIKNIVSFGIPTGSIQIASSIIGIILNKSLLKYGNFINISAMGIVYSIQALLVLPLIGLVQGAQPIISFNYGAKNYGRTLETLKKAVSIGVVFSISSYIITRVFPIQLISMFTDKNNKELIEVGVTSIKLWMLCMPLLGLELVGTNFFQAVGDPKMSTFLSLLRQIGFVIPMMIFLPKIMGYNGILLSVAIADFLSTIIVSIFLYRKVKKLKKLVN